MELFLAMWLYTEAFLLPLLFLCSSLFYFLDGTQSSLEHWQNSMYKMFGICTVIALLYVIDKLSGKLNHILLSCHLLNNTTEINLTWVDHLKYFFCIISCTKTTFYCVQLLFVISRQINLAPTVAHHSLDFKLCNCNIFISNFCFVWL